MIANIIHNAAFGNVDDMLAGLGPVKMEDVEEINGTTSDVGGASNDTPDVRDDTRDDDDAGKIPNFLADTPENIPDMDEPFEMNSFLDESTVPVISHPAII